jgi:hypothetical protein
MVIGTDIRSVRFIRVGDSVRLEAANASVIRRLWHALNKLKEDAPLAQKSFGSNFSMLKTSEHHLYPAHYAAIFFRDMDMFTNLKERKVVVGVKFMRVEQNIEGWQRADISDNAKQNLQAAIEKALPGQEVHEVMIEKNEDIKPYLNQAKAKIDKMRREAMGNEYLTRKIKDIEYEFRDKPYYDFMLEINL